MWIDRVKEVKKEKQLSNRKIAIATNGRLSERDVIRLLAGEYKKPFVDDVIALGDAVGLPPEKLFSETNSIVQSEKTVVEANEAKAQVIELTAKVESLEKEIAHLNELIKIKDELIEAKSELINSYKLNTPLIFK